MAWTRRTEKHHGYSDGYEAMVVNSIVDAVRAIKAHRRCGKNWCEDIPGKCSIPAHRCAASSWRFFESEWAQFLLESLGQDYTEVLAALERFGSKVE